MPRPTPVQSRSRVSKHVLAVLGLIFCTLAHTPFAAADELLTSEDAITREGSDHNWHRLGENTPEESTWRSIISRADAHSIDANNSPNRGNLTAGQTILWHYTQQLLQSTHANRSSALPSNISSDKHVEEQRHTELKKRESGVEERQSTSTVYISINTCSQPTWSGNGEQDDDPPQLSLSVGSSDSQAVGPGSSTLQTEIELDEGFAQYSFSANSGFYMAVKAPELSSDFNGGWTYDIAVSIDDFYHASNTSVPFLYLVDTDSTSALLVTENLTSADMNSTVYQQWMGLSSPLPFTMLANTNDNVRWGLTRSYCGLSNIAQIPSQRNGTTGNPFVNVTMVSRGANSKPKQQFMVGNLTAATSYNATLALIGNGRDSGKGVVGGGGTVWSPMSFTTKADGNCQLLYDLDFCSDVAYAVPSNLTSNTISLRSTYDTYATQLYLNFTYSLKQIQCNTSNDQRYSLARNCDDCANAYKQWLCAVTIPRCEDFSNTATFLWPRNVGQAFINNSMLSNDVLLTPYQPMSGAPTLPGSPIMQTWNWSFATNQSRNPAIIDNVIAPGPYKEVLPCEDICYNLVQSCPAALQFSCPLPGRGLEVGYAPRPSSRTVVQCNFPGAVYYIDDARQVLPGVITIFAVAFIVAVFTHS